MSATRVAALTGLAMAVAGAVLLGVADAIWFGTANTGGTELSVLYIAALLLLLWAAIIGAVVAVVLVRSAIRRGRPRPRVIDAVVVVAIAAVITGSVVVRPLSGSSDGIALALLL